MVGGPGAGLCPKCGDPSWYEKDGDDVVQRCLCGLHKIVRTRQGGAIMVHRPKPKNVTLPRDGTKISKCLVAVGQYHPRPMSTAEIARVAGKLESANVSIHLTLLQQRGLLEKVNNKRGKAEGSSWILSERAKELMGV